MLERRNRIDAAVADARHAADALAADHADRSALISRLRNRQRLRSAQIAALQLAATRVEHKSDALQAAATGDQQQPVVFSGPPTALTASAGARTITVSSTGYSLPGRTATGMPTGWGVVAV